MGQEVPCLPRHRVASIEYPATAGYPGWTVTITRDEFGRTTSVEDQNGVSAFSYDDLNRLVSANPAVGQSVTYQYLKDLTLARSIGRVTMAGVGTWEFREDGKGREAQVLNPFNQLTTRYFDPDSKLLREVKANGTYTDYAYTNRDWLGAIQHRLNGGAVLDTLQYFYTDGNGVYDPTGKIQREVDALNRTHAFFYSPSGELTAEQHPDFGTIEYFLDANGNRTAKRWNGATTEYYGVDAQNKLLWTNQAGNFAPVSGQAAPYRLFQYDLSGQPVVKEMRDVAGGPVTVDGYAWDGMGKLRRIVDLTTNTERYSATYDSDGLRSTSSAGGVNHIYSGGDGLLHDSAGTVYTPGVSQRTGGQDRWFHEDWIGSSRFMTDGTGQNVPTGYRFDAFGSQTASMGPDSGALKFAGQWEYQSDVPGGLQQLGHRLYDPGLGRFTSRDPLGFVAGTNLYRYSLNNPVEWVDPWGLYDERAGWEKGLENGFGIVGGVIGGLGGAGVGGGGGFVAGVVTGPGAILTGGAGAVYGAGIGVAGGVTIGRASGRGAAACANGVARLISDLSRPRAAEGRGPYDDLPEPRTVGPGRRFTPRQVDRAKAAIRERSGGVLRDDLTGEEMVDSVKSKRGVSPPANEVQADHLFPKILGGTNSNKNLRLRTRANNRQKGISPP